MRARPALLLTLFFVSSSCSDLESFYQEEVLGNTKNEKCTTCPSDFNQFPVSVEEITSVPEGKQNHFVGRFNQTKYLKVPDYGVHIMGSEHVSDWMMVKTYALAQNAINSLIEESDRLKFENHEFYVITDQDPDIGFVRRPGQRNTGNARYTVINEDLVCRRAVDTIRPNAEPFYRTWETPVHEFGHSLDLALGLREEFEALHRENNDRYMQNLGAEYFPWAVERWFGSGYGGKEGRERLKDYELSFFRNRFREEFLWVPSCEGRPEK